MPSESKRRPRTESTDYSCPKCQHRMTKVFSTSKKLKADHFLSCDNREGGCGAVMFWNGKAGEYELPRSERPVAAKPTKPTNLTEYACPKCGKPLELYEYEKEGQAKKMLRCANPKSRQGKCKTVAYFWTKRGTFWSPKLGEVKVSPLHLLEGPP